MIGKTLSHYRIQARLGAGGMGEVFRATDIRLGRDIALKVLPAEVASDPAHLERFQTEARALAALDHPNIVTMHSVEESDGTHFITMGLVVGESLDCKISSGMPLAEFLAIAAALTGGLSAAHAKGIVHRDLKPANVMITDQGEVKILDFGLAKLSSANRNVAGEQTRTFGLTRVGATIGTLPYMSPEQAEGNTVDSRSDLFSLGVMFYEMLTATRPFQGGTQAALVSSILRDAPRPLTEFRSDLPAVLISLVDRCLAKRLTKRCHSARKLHDELMQLQLDVQSGKAVAAPRRQDVASIAVLPLTDMSPARDHEWFCEGMAEELINGLSGVKGLRVAARASAFQLKGQDIRKIGELLSVKTVLDGSLRTAGKRMRVTAQLNNVDDGFQIWSKRYDRDMDDVFAVQDDIASDIVSALEVELGSKSATLATRQTENVEAYHLYLKGRHHYFNRTREEMSISEGCFKQALEKDPDYALALTGLADVHALDGFYGLMPTREAAERSIELARKAIALDPNLSEAHTTRGFIENYFFKNWESPVEYARRAVELNPANVVARLWGASSLTFAGIFDEANEWLERARLLDPLSPYAGALSAYSYLMQFRDETALECCETALKLNPDYPVALYFSAACFMRHGRHDGAIRAIEQAVAIVGRLPFYLGWLGWVYASTGRTDEARAIREELLQRAETECVLQTSRAWVHGGLGEFDEAFACLDEAVRDLEPLVATVHLPPFDPLRDDPRFAELLRRMGHPRGPR